MSSITEVEKVSKGTAQVNVDGKSFSGAIGKTTAGNLHNIGVGDDAIIFCLLLLLV